MRSIDNIVSVPSQNPENSSFFKSYFSDPWHGIFQIANFATLVNESTEMNIDIASFERFTPEGYPQQITQ